MPQKKLPDNNLTPQQRNKLVEDNINLVRYFAHQLCKDAQLFDDCVQEGCFGLMRAARLFDEQRHNKFSSFAAFEIQCSIRDFLFRNRMIRLPDEQRTQINKYQTAVRQMEINNVDVTTDLLIKTANEIGLSKEVHNQLINPISSLNVKSKLDEGDNASEVGDRIADTCSEDPLANMQYEELVTFMRDFFESAKIADEKTRRIVIAQMEQFISKALGEEVATFISLVSAEYPELDVKSKEFDRHYTRIAGIWRNQLNAFKEAFSSQAAFI